MNPNEKADSSELKEEALEGVSGGVRTDGSSKDHAPGPVPREVQRDLDDLEVER